MPEAFTNDAVRGLDELVFHSWSKQGAATPFVIAGGQGTRVWDHAGREWLDFSSQLVNTNIGHQHPKVIEAIKRQADILTTVAPSTANDVRGVAAQKILEKAGDYRSVFFTNGGADAIENAIRLARLHTGRDTVLSHYRSYHGNTGAAIVATGDWRRVPNQFARGHAHFFGPYLYRSEFWAETPEQECERALHHLRRVIESEGPESIAAILVEAIPGTAGVIVPPPGYLAGVKTLAAQHGILLIIDEVMAGFGRAGEWFAHQAHEVQPDLITFAKGVNSGYVPLGGVVISEEVHETFTERVFPGGLTYSGHPLACASAVASITAIEDEAIIENARSIGREVLAPGLTALAERHPAIGEVRGTGVFWALELVADRETREPLPAEATAAVKSAMLSRGLLPFVADNRIHVVPPCTVSPDEARTALSIYDESLEEVLS
ncbi:aspartate aminotransferase family protein [Humidisolicoccus flavus]|uniref:aspartate aminotransferase family protein n=1 Tax=Humidisolicoccus flavus TaxID=3111414 RepID=UPI00324C0691